MSCIQFINHRAAQDERPPRTPSDGTMFIHTVDHELVSRVITIKRQLKQHIAEDFTVEETKQ